MNEVCEQPEQAAQSTNTGEPTAARKGKGGRLANVLTVGVPATLAVVVALIFYFDVLRAPVSSVRPHDYEAARDNILKLAKHAISEAERGQKAFFVSHVGCGARDVWQNPAVIQIIKRMEEKGVAVKLGGAREGSGGQKHMNDWVTQLAKRLDDEGVPPGAFDVFDRELPCHSAVAGSERDPRAYICVPRTDDIYPTEYLTTTDRDVCLQWKQYLLDEFQTRKQAAVGSHQ